MNVYFGCSTQRILELKEAYSTTRQAILTAGNKLTRDWLDDAILLKSKNTNVSVDRSNYYEEVMNAILQADLCIFDCTVPSMAVGHQITFSLDKGKPTLMLVDGNTQNVEGMFVAGSTSPNFTHRNYKDQEDLTRIVSWFLAECSPSTKIRFSLVLDRVQDDYIEWASFKYKTTKTDIIKGAIAQRISVDENYKQYNS
jgi:hypothetical protein